MRRRQPPKPPQKQTPPVIKKGRGRPKPVLPTQDNYEASPPDEQEPPTAVDTAQVRGIVDLRIAYDDLEGVRAPMMTIRTRRVSKAVTKKRWTSLPPESRAKAISILRDIERQCSFKFKH